MRSGLAFAVISAPRVNAPAWFGLAVAVPLLLLALAAAVTKAGLPKTAGLYAAVLLTPAILLALNALERQRAAESPADVRDRELARALVLTVGQACGLLLVVMLGARFSGEAVAVGLGMAGVPLALCVAKNLWRRAVRPLDERLASLEMSASRNWTAEWLEAEGAKAALRPAARVTPLRPAPRVTLAVTPVPADEGWMRQGEAPQTVRAA